jgi:cytosine deaminase
MYHGAVIESFDLILQRCRLPDGREADVAAATGASPRSARHRTAHRAVDCAGCAVTPGLVDAHIHLTRRSSRAARRVSTAPSPRRPRHRRGQAHFTVEDIRARAPAVLDMAVGHGTTAMRSHVEVDPIVGLAPRPAPLRQEYARAIDLQLCAFAQEGILRFPETEALLEQALGSGADLIGGCPYNDTDAHAQIDIVFRLAQKFDVDVDFHIDFFDEPEHMDVLYVAEQTVRHGWQGRVVVGKLTELAALPPVEQDRIIDPIRAAGLGVIILPATDLYLMGRKDIRSIRRGLTPVKRLLAAGVPVAAATNNVRNAFTPVGTADPALMGFLVAVGCHMGARTDLLQALAMLTEHPARILRLRDYGVAVGLRADLVVWEAAHVDDVIATLAPRRLVAKGGRVTVEHERAVKERWRGTH